MVDIPKRMIERSGPALTSREEPNIFRDPPKAVWTRKKERITEADVTWMTRPGVSGSDDTRINQAIRHYARGVNPSVEVEYQNRGGGSKLMHGNNSQAGSIYKTKVVRPPLFPVESTLPLSRPRTHQNKSVETNPGLTALASSTTLANSLDWTQVAYPINTTTLNLPLTTTATAYYKIESPLEMSATYAINEQRPQGNMYTNINDNNTWIDPICREKTPYGTLLRPKPQSEVNSNISSKLGELSRNDDASHKVKENLIIENVKPNFQIIVYDPSNHVASEVSANIREKQNIAVRAAIGAPITFTKVNGEKVLTRRYNWSAVQTNVGLDQVILTLEDPGVKLERNVPLYASETNLSLPTDVLQRTNVEYDLFERIKGNASTNPKLEGYNETFMRSNQDMVRTKESLDIGGFQNRANSIPKFRSDLPISNVRLNSNPINKQASNQAYTRAFNF